MHPEKACFYRIIKIKSEQSERATGLTPPPLGCPKEIPPPPQNIKRSFFDKRKDLFCLLKFFEIFQDLLEDRLVFWEIYTNGVNNDFELNHPVPMNQKISHAGDISPGEFWVSVSQFWVDLFRRLSNNRERSFQSSLRAHIILPLLFAQALDKRLGMRHCVQNINDVLLLRTFHRYCTSLIM